MVSKANANDFLGRFREIISDPINLLIERVPEAGTVHGAEVVLHNGNRAAIAGNFAYYGNFSHVLIVNRGVHEPLEEYAFQEVMRRMPEAPLMVELGAYWGHYSMWLKKLRPLATNIMVEPDANNLAAGKHNFGINGYAGEFIQALVGKGQFEVDAFMESRGITHLDVLHVDIQGFELEMMAGSRRALEQAKIDYAFVSTHSQELHHGIVRGFEGFGYRVEVASDFDNDTTSFDGFVLASSPRAQHIFKDFTALGRDHIVHSRPGALLDSLVAIRRASQPG